MECEKRLACSHANLILVVKMITFCVEYAEVQKDSNTSFDINTYNTPLVSKGHYFFGMSFVKNAEKLNTNEVK